MRTAADDRLTDLDRPQRGRRAPRRWTGTVSQRASAARRSPQAIFKISSYSHSAGAVVGRFEYITREGEAEAEGPSGELLDQAALAARADAWSEEAGARHTRRVSMSAVVSFPADVDEDRATEAARQFFAAAFAANHDYVFTGHRDTKNFHVHVVVQSAGLDGKQLRIGREDIQDLRMLFAEKAAAQGIELDASPRWARGKEQARPASREVEGIRRRFREPEQQLAGAWFLSAPRRTQLAALVDVRRGRATEERAVSPLEYARAAERVAGQIGATEDNREKVSAIKAAVQLARSGLQRSGDEINTAAAGAAVHVVGQVDKAIAAQITELREDPEAWREALSARRPLADQLAATRPSPERKWAREADAPRVPGQEVGAQALEYARAARWAVAQSADLPTDADRVAAVKGAVDMARFGWEISAKETCPEVERATAREIIDKTERELRGAIEQIKDPEAKRDAIQARAGLYRAGVKEYRAAKRETERPWGQEAGRPAAAELNRHQEDVTYERTKPESEREPSGAGVEREGGGVGGRAGRVASGDGGERGPRPGDGPGASRGAEQERSVGLGPGAPDVAAGDAESASEPHRPDRAPGPADRTLRTRESAVGADLEPGAVAGGGGDRGRDRGREPASAGALLVDGTPGAGPGGPGSGAGGTQELSRGMGGDDRGRARGDQQADQGSGRGAKGGAMRGQQQQGRGGAESGAGQERSKRRGRLQEAARRLIEAGQERARQEKRDREQERERQQRRDRGREEGWER